MRTFMHKYKSWTGWEWIEKWQSLRRVSLLELSNLFEILFYPSASLSGEELGVASKKGTLLARVGAS